MGSCGWRAARRAAFGLVVTATLAGRARAQDVAPVPVYADPDRKAPRLVFARGPAECPSEEIFRREVAIALEGADLFDDTAPDVLRVWFEKVPGGYRGTLEYTDANGETEPPKVQTFDHCITLGRWVAGSASAFIPKRLVRKAAAPDPATPPPEPHAAPVPSKPASFVPPVLPPQRRLPPSPPPRNMDVTIGLSGLVLMTAGLTANVGPAFGIMGDIRYDWFSLGLELRGVPPAVAYAAEPIPGKKQNLPRVEIDVSQWTALLVPCGRWKYLVGCAVAQAGLLYVQGPIDGGAHPNITFGPRLGFEVPFAERFAVFGFGEALFMAYGAQATFNLDAPGLPAPNVTWKQSIVSGFFGAGLSVKFQ